MRGCAKHSRWKNVLALFFLLSFISASAVSSADSLSGELARLATSPNLGKMRVSVKVVELGNQHRVVYELNSRDSLKPASNQKIFTTAAALSLLPEDFTFRTVLALRGEDLVVIGSGDPAFGDPELSRSNGQTITAIFHQWADKLKSAGIERIAGDLVFDDAIFEQQFINPSWPGQFKGQMQTRSLAPVGGLNFNANCIDVVVRPGKTIGSPAEVSTVPGTAYAKIQNTCKTAAKGQPSIRRTESSPPTILVSGSVSKAGSGVALSIPDPGMFFATTLRTVLAAKGVAIEGQTRRERVCEQIGLIPQGLRIVATHEQTMPEVLRRCNKDSQNMFAEAIMKTVGAYARTSAAPRVGSYVSARQAIEQFLQKAGISTEGCVFDDGSGLSHANRATADAFTDVLIYMSRHPQQKLWMENLATPGADGTLRKRMKDLNGRVFAKTGHINGVSTLSGYVFGPGKQVYAFSILCNDTHLAKTSSHGLQDGICRKLATWKGE